MAETRLVQRCREDEREAELENLGDKVDLGRRYAQNVSANLPKVLPEGTGGHGH